MPRPLTLLSLRVALHRPHSPLLLRRLASTAPPAPRRHYLSTTLLVGGGVLFLAYYYDSKSLVHEHVAMPLMRLFADPEEGHRLAVRVLAWDKWARPRDMGVDGDELQAELFGMTLKNPVGIAAGFDKDAEAIDGLFDLGFGYVEVGSVTPEPQPGNPKPRFFRLEEDDACINRYGFNSLGHGYALARLRLRLAKFAQDHPSLFPSPLPATILPPAGLPRSLRPGQVLAVNLGKNKASDADSNDDYIRGVRTLGPYADVVVINVSSPNTPGLRALQGKQQLVRLLNDVVEERNRIAQGTGLPKIAVKVASDLSEDELADVASAVRSSGVEGVIVSNTTIRRKELNLVSNNQDQVGGLSGKPLFPYALNALKTLRPLLPPTIPIIGCGGISSGSDALDMANAGASIVQIYTSFGFRGVGTPRLIKDEISERLNGESWKTRVGSDWASSGQPMGWDENRLKQESQALVEEAKGLAELLRQSSTTDEKETAKLVEEAERVLGIVKEKGEPSAASGSAAAVDHSAVPSLLQDSSASAPTVEQGPLAAPVEAAVPPPSSQSGFVIESGAASIGEALIAEPVSEVDLAPIVVLEEKKTNLGVNHGGERDNEWEQAVKAGPKRLV
ncbi:dihydroorotate dehydrogenase (fumarate) [Cryptococcus decagattii]|uniref:Dihydroorotate dehydrogenase (quinone), mitochondrial n=1 Tax=Cryptococcus decagattii TaxID=1859122 RepID=A0ABZ2ATE6_9TREE